tara:strand:- start:4 stop:111 length:108 start_codon:yes stop_codon:yes gene_type:complete
MGMSKLIICLLVLDTLARMAGFKLLPRSRVEGSGK